MPCLPGRGRSAGGSVLNPSDAPTGGCRALSPETSGVIMPAPRTAALYGDFVGMDFLESPRNRGFSAVNRLLPDLRPVRPCLSFGPDGLRGFGTLLRAGYEGKHRSYYQEQGAQPEEQTGY